jgi:hypothetical protein
MIDRRTLAAYLLTTTTAAFLPRLSRAAVPADARAIAKQAYLYAFAMMENYQTWYKQAVDNKAPEYVGGFGRFRHYSQPFTPANHDVVTPNNDTPYSWSWLDLRSEPYVLSAPAVPKDRYYVVQWVDLFTQNFAYVGVRATGYGAGSYLIAGPNWHGEKPQGIRQVFKAETEIVGSLMRTALNGPEDVPNVQAIQAQFKLQPLSAFLDKHAPSAAPPIDFPPYDRAKTQGHDFIEYLNFLLQFAEPPVKSEIAIRKRFETIGIGPGWPWDASKVDPALLSAIDAGIADAKQAIKARLAVTQSSNGLFGPRSLLKTDYLTRDVAAAKGLYGNNLEEAWYGGYDGVGSKPAIIHFAPGKLPPAKFFWSMTLYTLPDRFLYANEIERYSVGDRTKGLVMGKDGSLTLNVSHEPPAPEMRANWLPAPAGPYVVVARLYGPKQEAIDGRWKLPPLQDASVLDKHP